MGNCQKKNMNKLEELTTDEIIAVVKNGDVEKIQNIMLVKSIEQFNDCFRIFHTAAQFNQAAILKLILKHVDTVDRFRNSRGETVLMTASRYGKIDCLKVLLEHGADVSIKSSFGDTAVMKAATYGHMECVKILSEHGGGET